MLLEQLSHQLERGSLVAFGLDQAVQDLAFSVDRSPEIHLPAADLYKHLVQMPTIIRSWPEASEPPCIAVSELENPTTHSLIGDFEAALGQQILDVSEAQREAAIEPYGVLDDLGRESVATIGDLFHRWRLDCCHSTRKPINVTTPFYILFPVFMALFFAAWGLGREIDNKATVFFIGAVAFIAVFTLLRAVSDMTPENWGNGLKRVVLYRIDSIGFGIVLYLLKDHIRKISVVLIAAIIVAILAYLFDGYERIHRGVSHPIEFRFLIFAATAIFSCAVLVLFLRLDNAFQTGLREFSLWGGRVSYGIYLLHIPVAALTGKILDVWAGAFVGLSLLAILAVTTVVYYFFEKPILDARPGFQFDDHEKG